MRLVPTPHSLTPLAEATFWESRLAPTTVTQPRGSESACRGEAGELVHLDPEAPPCGGRDWWSCRPTEKDGSASETKHAKCFPKNREGEEQLGRLASRCTE